MGNQTVTIRNDKFQEFTTDSFDELKQLLSDHEKHYLVKVTESDKVVYYEPTAAKQIEMALQYDDIHLSVSLPASASTLDLSGTDWFANDTVYVKSFQTGTPFSSFNNDMLDQREDITEEINRIHGVY